MRPIRLAAIALAVSVASCSDATAPTRSSFELQVARQRWHTQDLHTYAFILQRSCFCVTIDPLYVVVVNDAVAGVLNFRTGESLDPRFGETVDDLFDFIQNAIDRRAHVIRFEFDGTKGFPTTIEYDGAAAVADDEVTYSVSDVHPIAPPGT